MENSIYEIDAKSLKEKAYQSFKSNYIVEADGPNIGGVETVDGDNDAIAAVKEALDLTGDWKSQWIVSNADGAYTVRFDKDGFRPVIVTFRPTIGNSMTFSIQFGEDGNCDYFDDDTPPDDPIVEIARYVQDENGRFGAMAEQFRERSAEIEREAGKKSDEDKAEADADKELMDMAAQPDANEVPPPPGA